MTAWSIVAEMARICRRSRTRRAPPLPGEVQLVVSVSAQGARRLMEGVFDLAVLWQTVFRNTTCAIGTHLSPTVDAYT